MAAEEAADQEEETNQSFLEAAGLEFLISGDGSKVALSSLHEHKVVCLFFSASWCRPCRNFTPQLAELYDAVNRNGKKLEIIFISSDEDEASFSDHIKSMPWPAAPFDGGGLQKTMRNRYRVERIPSLIPLDLLGMAVEEDAVQLVEDYGVDAFPFGAERREELKAMDDARLHGGSLYDLLGSSERDYVISKDGSQLQVAIASLVGKTIGLYFGAHWCPPCTTFRTILAEAHNELKVCNRGEFEVVFVSTDRDEEEYNLHLTAMPWLAIPYSDKARHDLTRIFNVKGIPALVVLGPDGKVLGADGRTMIASYGARAFPFTESRASEVEAALREEGQGLPKQVADPRHSHPLKLDMAKAYVCDSCRGPGRFWVFSCDQCDFDLHPTCVEGNHHHDGWA